jgi:hypothetical protein
MSAGDKRRYSLFPKTLASVVEPVTRPLLKKQGLAGSRILTEWESIVGPELARRSLPEKLSFPAGKKTGGTLTISVENGFATHLQHMQPLILERVAGYFGYAAVSRIQISHGWQPAPPPATPPLNRKPLPAACLHMADGVEDEELKAALQSLAMTLADSK